jgi:hypothetical protein
VTAAPGKATRRAALATFVGSLLLGGCSSQPYSLSSQFTPPESPAWSTAATASCRVRVTEIHDLRADPLSMGVIGNRPIRGADAPAWVRSGLDSLGLDQRILLVGAELGNDADLALSLDLLKAYMHSITTQKSANVVLRVRYSRHGQPLDEQVYRGVDTGGNWAQGDGETQEAFDAALAESLTAIDRDIRTRCAAAVAGAAPRDLKN